MARLHCLQTLPADIACRSGGWKIDAAKGPGQGPGAASVGHGPWVGDTGAHVQSLTGHLSNQLRTQGPRKVTFAALQTRLVHTRATRIAPTPDGRLRVSARARTADPVCSSVCLALSLSGLILSAVQRSRLGCRRSQQESACSRTKGFPFRS